MDGRVLLRLPRSLFQGATFRRSYHYQNDRLARESLESEISNVRHVMRCVAFNASLPAENCSRKDMCQENVLCLHFWKKELLPYNYYLIRKELIGYSCFIMF